MTTEKNAVRIGQRDSLIILRPDGTFEASIPKVTTEKVPEHIFMGAAILYALNTPSMVSWLQDCFRNYCTQETSALNLNSPVNR